MNVVGDIAKTLRSTEKMALAFNQSVREKLGNDVPDVVILDALKKINPRSIEINRVVAQIKTDMSRRRQVERRSSKATVVASASRRTRSSTRQQPAQRRKLSNQKSVQPKTLIEQLDEILKNNWNRAEKEGLKPQRLNGSDFIDAVHRYTDPRDATRRLILKACKTTDTKDVLITPTIIADAIREEN